MTLFRKEFSMNHFLIKYFSIIWLLLFAAAHAYTAPEAEARAAAFAFDSVWFYRDGTRVVPKISNRWLTVVFLQRYTSNADDTESATGGNDGFVQKKARALIKSHDRLVDYLYDPNIAEDACFFRMRNGMKLEDLSRLINQLSQDGTVKYVHPTLVLNGKTFAFFDTFEMEWKTGTPREQRESLLRAAHVVQDENVEKENRYKVVLTAAPFFRALNLLAEDIRVLRVTPYLVEIKPSITARLSVFMNGGNIGDSIPFTLTITFTDRVSIDPSSISTLNLRPPELQKELFDCIFDPYDYAKAVTKSPVVITGQLRFYAPGQYTIPPIKISYSCPSCSNNAAGNLRSIETEPVLFKVSSIIPSEKTEYRLIVPTDPVSHDFNVHALHRQSQRYLWLAIICFAALVPCAFWFFLLRHQAAGERKHKKKRKDFYQLAEQLRAMLQTTPQTPHWGYLSETGALLREYLLVRYGVDPKYQGGSAKQFLGTVREHLPAECIDSLGSVLTAIDNSVALESEHIQGIDQLQLETLKIVDLVARNNSVQG